MGRWGEKDSDGFRNRPSLTQSVILGFDPGRDKCGLAVMGQGKQLYYHQVVSATEAISAIETLYQQFPIALLVMGNQTTAKHWKQQLESNLIQPLPIVLVDERYSSLEARDRYWQMYPPKGLAGLIPTSLRTPPRAWDDIVAILLIERYLEQHSVAKSQRES
ncbi:MAG: pre-16S rRNA-processing nuclease YqgF [Chroococcidiopsidaceae cyanobacterium CP_BM_ER_R8_30]|nr:pre-16S rRNA-processing nuclease YqgF [Chroococcidiopsidaceae cyanobacterium CP_BM_ER_R8_30]